MVLLLVFNAFQAAGYMYDINQLADISEHNE